MVGMDNIRGYAAKREAKHEDEGRSVRSGGESEAKSQPMESPWVAPRRQEEPKNRVVGWKNGVAISKQDMERILKTDKLVRQQYMDDRKILQQSKYKDIEEPLAGLPPAWQAFWSTVPQLDAQAAFRHFQKAQDREERKKKEAETQAMIAQILPELEKEGEPVDVHEEVKRLEDEFRKRKEVFTERQRCLADWERKLMRARTLDRDEEERERKFARMVDKASYRHGVLQGKIRSSDIYFTYLLEDTKSMHGKKMSTLTRAGNLMHKSIDEMKGDVRGLLKVAADMLPAPPDQVSLTNGGMSQSGMSQKGFTTDEESDGERLAIMAPGPPVLA